MNRPLTGSRAVAVAVLSVAVLGLTACSDDSGDSAEPPATESPTSTTPSPDPSVSESASTESPEPTTAPGIAPATGPLITVGTSSLHAPAGWEADEGITTEQVTAFRPGGGGSLSLGEFESLGSPTELEIQVQAATEGLPDDATIERLPDLDLGGDGTLAAHLTYTTKGSNVTHDVVFTQRGGQSISINFDLKPGDLKENPDLVASVLASFAWV